MLVVEDNPLDSEALVAVLENNDYQVTYVATTIEQAISAFNNKLVDIVIIDVFLGANPDGITFAEKINQTPDAARPFVFLTNSKDRQIFERAKLTHPFSFLLKPFNQLELLYAIEIAIEKFYVQPNVFAGEGQNAVITNDYLFIKKKNSLKKVSVDEIIYIKVEERYCTIVTEKEKFLILISLTKTTELLNPAKFLRTHRNFIVNYEKIEEIFLQDNLILLAGNHKVTLSDNYKDIIRKFHVLK